MYTIIADSCNCMALLFKVVLPRRLATVPYMGPPRAKEASTEVVRPRIEVHKEGSEETEIEHQFNHHILVYKDNPINYSLAKSNSSFL